MLSFAQSIIMRNTLEFEIEDSLIFSSQLLNWANQFNVLCYLNSNVTALSEQQKNQQINHDILLGVGAVAEICFNSGHAFQALKNFYDHKRDWLFGYLSYDLKNETELLSSENTDSLDFPALHFFQARYVFSLSGKCLQVHYLNELDTAAEIVELLKEIKAYTLDFQNSKKQQANIQAKVGREKYLQSVSEIKKHIQRGDIYEMNYCVEFFATQMQLNPLVVYEALNALSQTPLSCYYKNNHHYLMCASPERFMKKVGTKLISQPIKGTRKRGANAAEDTALKRELANDTKEQSENVMIVDLVRNDLSRSAQRGTVRVEELFGVHTFKQVHQLISTISCELKPEIHFVDALKNAFPMGSMTGAPKVSAMQLIESFESTKRGLYSGTVGYISPNGDFDFNVVIRSILYNSKNHYVSFMVGSAITANSNAQLEYEECLLKAEAMFQALKHSNI